MTDGRVEALLRTVLGSLRTKAFLGLVGALAVAIGVSFLIDTQITEHRVSAEADELVDSALDVAAAVVDDDRAELRTALRFNVQSLLVRGLDGAGSGPRLRRRIGLIQRNLGTDGIALVDVDGHVVASSGLEPAEGAFDAAGATAATVQLVDAVDGTAVEALGVPVDGERWLVATETFEDARAFELRRLLVGNEVVLVHDGRILGSTTGDVDALGPAVATPSQTRPVTIDGTQALVGFAPVGPDTYVGVVIPRLLSGLEGDLASGRILVFLALVVVVLTAGNVLIGFATRPLRELTETAEAVRRGDRTRPFTSPSSDEIGQLAVTLEAMRTALNDQLTVISLQADAIRRATQRIVTARDAERRRMAQDLHDGVQQQLVMLRLRIGMLDDADPEERQALGREVEGVIARLRETAQAIFPSILADRGVSGALYSLAAAASLPITLDMKPDPVPRLPEAVEAGTYFIVSEAVTNVVKHAGASRIRIRVRVSGGRLLVMVADDGDGFDRSTGEGAGLQNLHDRATALGGIAHVRSEPDVGTVVAVRIPLRGGSVGTALEEEEDGGDPAVEVVGVAEAELAEDGVGVLLDRALADDEGVRDR